MRTFMQIGAGGTGSHFIGPALAFLDTHFRDSTEEWQYVIVDGDNFESQNLERQMFDPGLVATNKAEAMKQMYNRYPSVIAVPKFIGKTDLDAMMQDGDTIFICADNHSIRALVQERALELRDCVIVNAGNEMSDGSVQLFVRQNGENKTPPITFLHPEIQYVGTDDRAPMSCQQVAELPGGGQLILANQQAAAWMLAALWRYLTDQWVSGWTELQFDLTAGTVHHIDMRDRRGWAR